MVAVNGAPVVAVVLGFTIAATMLSGAGGASLPFPATHVGSATRTGSVPSAAAGAVSNFTAAINRLVELVGLAGSGILALVWARVALSWFSNDIAKKVQAKDRARDALVGTLLFVAAVSGLVWGLAHWVVTGT